jgi:hypothetical protein
MEKESITIEIKQEVSVTLLWIVAGVILVSAAFFLAPQSIELWPALNAAGIAAALYLAALLFYVLRKPLPGRPRIVVGIVAVVVISSAVFSWTRMQDQTQWQANQLMKIRAVIGRGVKVTEIAHPLLKSLDAYHLQGTRKANTLADEFRKMYPGVVAGSNIFKPRWEGDDMTIMVETLDPDRIVLLSQETFVKGRDPQFKNYDGKTGMIQEKFVLTEKGITHVSEN